MPPRHRNLTGEAQRLYGAIADLLGPAGRKALEEFTDQVWQDAVDAGYWDAVNERATIEGR